MPIGSAAPNIPPPEPDLRSRVRSSSRHVAAATVVSKLIAMTLQVYLFKLLAVEDQGRYTFFLGIQIYFLFFTNLGMQNSLQRFIPEYFAMGQFRKVWKAYSATALANFMVAACLFLLIYLFYNPLASPFKMQDYKHVFVCFAISSMFFFQLCILNTVLANLFLHARQSWAQVLYVLLKSGVTYAFLKMGFGLKGIFIADAIALVPVVGFLFFNSRKWLFRKMRENSDKDKTFEWKRFSRYSIFNLFTIPQGATMEGSMIYLILSLFVNPFQLGLYGFCARSSNMITQALPHRMLQSVLRPMFFERFTAASQKGPALNDMFNGLCRIALFFLMPIFVIITVAREPIIRYVFKPEYLVAQWLLVVTFALLAASFAELAADLAIQAIEKIQYRFYSQFITFAMMAVTVSMLLAGFGLMSVVISTGLISIIRNAYLYLMLRRFTKIDLEWKSFGIIVINSLIMGIAVLPIVSFLPSILGLLLTFVAGGLVYLLATYFLSPFSKHEQKHILEMLKLRTS